MSTDNIKRIIGFKCFNKGLINQHGVKFHPNKIHKVNGEVVFGNSGNGYHFCKDIENTLRYFHVDADQIDLCKVEGSGDIKTSNDEYNGYFDMYVASELKVVSILSFDDILSEVNNMCVDRFIRFIQSYPLDKHIFMDLVNQKFANNFHIKERINKHYSYYQEGNEDAFGIIKNKVKS